jgi:hypothetical protein
MPLAKSFMKPIKLLVFLCVQLIVHPSEGQTPTRKFPFVNYTEVGGLFGRSISGTQVSEVVQNKLSLSLQTLNGVQLSKRLAVGAFVGVDWYKAALLMPVGGGVRWQLTQPSTRHVSVFASTDAGYALNWLHKSSTEYSLKGGLMMNPGIGLRFGKPENGGLILTVSYKRQAAQAEKPLRWGEVSRDEQRVYNRLAIRLGMSF